MNQSEFLAISFNLLKVQEKSCIWCFASHCLKNWSKIFQSITERSTCNHLITVCTSDRIKNCSIDDMHFNKHKVKIIIFTHVHMQFDQY